MVWESVFVVDGYELTVFRKLPTCTLLDQGTTAEASPQMNRDQQWVAFPQRHEMVSTVGETRNNRPTLQTVNSALPAFGEFDIQTAQIPGACKTGLLHWGCRHLASSPKPEGRWSGNWCGPEASRGIHSNVRRKPMGKPRVASVKASHCWSMSTQ